MFVLALLVYWKGISLRVKMRGKIQFSMSIGNQRSKKVEMFLYELSLIIDTSTKSKLIKTQS